MALAVAGAAPAPPPQSPPAPQQAGPVLHAPPSQKVRIGLTNDPVKVRVFAEGGIVIRDPVKRAPIWKKRFDSGVYLVSDLSGAETGLVYRVQVASFAAKDQADAKQAEIEALLKDAKVVLAYNPDRKSWRVRVGEFRSREDAASLVQRLNDEGYNELWITEEGRAIGGRRRIRLVDDRWQHWWH